jgi:hypothetical protein
MNICDIFNNVSIFWSPGRLVAVLVALCVFPSPARSSIERPVQIRLMEREIQIGTELDAPSYYVEYRAPDGSWHPWSSSSRIDSGQTHLWFRGIFEPDTDDAMLWDVPVEADTIYSPDAADSTLDGHTAWTTIGRWDDTGALVGQTAVDLMMQVAASDQPVQNDTIPAPASNQAHATPDPGQATLYWRNSATGQPVAWHLSETGSRKSGLALSAANPATSWQMEATADVDGDGSLDLIWRNASTGRVVVWFLEPDGWLRSAQQVLDANLSTSWRIVAADDVDGDNVPDLIWFNVSTLRAVVWFLNANGTRKGGVVVLDSNVATGWQVIDVADIDGDGVPDLVWFNSSTRLSVVWFLAADGTFRESVYVLDVPVTSGWSIVEVADVDSDGTPDLIWHHSTTGRAYIWFLESDGTRREGASVLDANVATAWRIVGASDVDGDGTPDLLWHNRSTGRSIVWFLDSAGAYTSGQEVLDANLSTAWQVEAVSP